MPRFWTRPLAGCVATLALAGCSAPVQPTESTPVTQGAQPSATASGSGPVTVATPAEPGPAAVPSPTELVVSPVAPSPATSGRVPAPAPGGVLAPSAAPGAASAATARPAPSPLSSGQHFVTAPTHGVKVAVPSGWQPFDLTLFADPGVKAALAPVAQKLGLSVDAYVAQLTSTTDVLVAGPEASGFTPTLSVRKESAAWSDAVPTDTEAHEQLAAVSGTVESVSRVTTPLGAGYAVRYTRPGDAAGTVVHAASLGLPAPGDTMFLAVVEAGGQADRDRLVTLVTTTLQKA